MSHSAARTDDTYRYIKPIVPVYLENLTLVNSSLPFCGFMFLLVLFLRSFFQHKSSTLLTNRV